MRTFLLMILIAAASAASEYGIREVGAAADDAVRLGVTGAANASPSIAVSGDRVAIAWGARGASGATDVYVATSVDGARTFSAPERVNDTPGTARLGGELPPRVAFAGSHLVVAWTAREEGGTSILSARSNNGASRFAAPRVLQRGGAPGDRGWAALAADNHGATHVIWLDHRGLAPDAPAGPSHHGHDRSASAQHDGVAMAQKSALYYAAGDGAEREIAKGVCYCCKTALATGADGAIFAAWRHVYPGNIRDIAFTTSRDGGRTFASPVRVSVDEWQLEGCPDDGPALAVDARRTVHVVWPTVTGSPEPHKAIFHATTSDGRTFTARERVSPVGRNTAHPQIAVAGSDVWVLWDEIVGGRRSVFMAAREANGAFGAPRMLSGEAVSASYPVAGVADGVLVAAWVEGAASDSQIVVRRVR
jgi:hypothetical protein